MEIRTLRDDEVGSALYLWSQAFDQGNRNKDAWHEYAEAFPGRSVTHGVFDEAGLQAVVGVIDFREQFGPDVVLKSGGIGGVACLPASRGKGYAGNCLDFALQWMHEAGFITSTLYPFSWDFYRRHGWEWTGVENHYSVPSRIIRASGETEHVRAATHDDWPALRECYTAFSKNYRGMLARSDSEWNYMLKDKKDKYNYVYIYERDGQVEGYQVFTIDKGDETSLREFIVTTPRARQGLLGLLRRHEMQIKKFRWDAPADDGLFSHLLNWEMETKTRPRYMVRIVDVPSALQAWKPIATGSGAFTAAVRDDHAPWNTGTWSVEFEGGQTQVKPTEAAPQISLTIQTLTQAYYGALMPDQLRAEAHLTVSDETAFAAFRDLFTGPPSWINDDF